MGAIVVTGAQLVCPFGTAPSVLSVSSQTLCLGCSKPIATVLDTNAGSNIAPFGMCNSLANPQVAAATAAALGVLTPQPCNLVPTGTWIPGKPSLLIDGKPVLLSDATLLCGTGLGTISIVSPGQAKITAG